MTVEPETFILLAEYCAAQKRHSGDTLLSHLRGTSSGWMQGGIGAMHVGCRERP